MTKPNEGQESDRFSNLLNNVDFTFHEDSIRKDSEQLRGLVVVACPYLTEDELTQRIERFVRKVIDLKKGQPKR